MSTPTSSNVIPDASDSDAVRAVVKDSYGALASSAPAGTREHAARIGYSEDDLAAAPDDANLGVGCGNPTALAGLQPGERVVDLGSGGGLDALIAAQKVGAEGRVIGVDMTPEMLQRARAAAVEAGVHGHVEFREGIIEALPLVDESVDVVISNCVVNLSPDKAQVFREAFRVLTPGGRLAVSDILLSEALEPDMARLASVYVGCVGGALLAEDYLSAMREAGFTDIRWTRSPAADVLLAGGTEDPMVKMAVQAFGQERIDKVARTVWSYKIQAQKPATRSTRAS